MSIKAAFVIPNWQHNQIAELFRQQDFMTDTLGSHATPVTITASSKWSNGIPTIQELTRQSHTKQKMFI